MKGKTEEGTTEMNRSQKIAKLQERRTNAVLRAVCSGKLSDIRRITQISDQLRALGVEVPE